MMDKHSPPAVTFDLMLYVLRNTLLSPFFVAGMALFSKYGQTEKKRILAGTDDLTPFAIYLGICWILWFLPFFGRVWENKSWRQGWRGILGMHRIDWSEEIVLVTGGNQGLGKSIVEILDTKKVTVVVLDLHVPKASSSEYNDVHFYQCDVSDFKQVQDAAERIRKEVGHPTVIINNAGVVSGRSILDLSEKDIRQTFNVNTIAHFWTIKAFLPDMLNGGKGHIVNISSVLGQIGVNMMTDYCASKHAVVGMHESLRSELRQSRKSDNIRLSLVMPGHIRTALFAQMKPFNPLAAFLLPLQEPYQIAKAIVDRIEREEGGPLCVPKMVGISWAWKSLPIWLSDFVRLISDSDSSMMGFHEAKKQ